MQGSRNSRCFIAFVDQPVRFLAVVLLLTSLLGFWRSSLRETQRTWYAEPRMRWGPTGRTRTTHSSEKSTELLWQSATTGKGWGRACEHGICCKATSWRLAGRRPGFDGASESWSRACTTNWHLLRYGDNFEHRPYKELFFKVTQTRLEQRSHRPVNEACADSVHLRSSLRLFALCLIKTMASSSRCHMRGSFFYFIFCSVWSTLRLSPYFVCFQYSLFLCLLSIFKFFFYFSFLHKAS